MTQATPCAEIATADVAPLVTAAAQEELLPLFRRATRSYKADGSVVTEADGAVQTHLERALAQHWPNIPLLGEEMAEARQRRIMTAAQGAYWCLDPLDGTSNFASGVPFFAVSLALMDARGACLGIVYDPIRDELFSAERGGRAELNGESIGTAALAAAGTGVPPIERCIAGVDFKRLPSALARRLAAQPPYASQRNFGACALEWCWLADGRLHLSLHGGQKLWDYAAGTRILEQVGGAAVTLTGEALFDGGLAPRSAVAVCDAALLPAWRAAVEG